MDVFLGNFKIDVHNLPSSLEATLISLDQNGIALLAACFAMAMTILCVLVAGQLLLHYRFPIKQLILRAK